MAQEEVKLAFQIEMESRKAVQGLSKIEKGLRQISRRNSTIRWDDRKGFGDFKKRLNQYRNMLRGNQRELKEMNKVIKEVGGKGHGGEYSKALKQFGKEHAKFTGTVQQGEKKLAERVRTIREAMRHADTKEAKKALEDQIKAQQKAYAKDVNAAKRSLREKQRALGASLKGPATSLIMEKHEDQVASRRKSAERFQEALEGVKTAEVGKDLADGFADGLGSLGGKDLLGATKAGIRMSSTLLKGTGKLGMKWGRDLQIKGLGMGGKGGAALAKAGGGLSKIGPLVATLSKLGPILSMSASVMMAIVKLIIDVDAHGKEMNRTILEGASTADLFYRNLGQAERAGSDLKSVLKDIRDDASDVFENLDWGTQHEEILQVINTIAQQGASLNDLRQAFKNVRESTHRTGMEMASFGDLARTALAYSKLLGVSIQEIADFQAEMMVELGTSLTSTKMAYALMAREASEAGIASNKFFSIIRGVSSDLGLYNTRIDQAASLLKLLGKSMNPREAQKFLNFATSGVQQMDQLQRTRIAVAAGLPEVKAIGRADFAEKIRTAIVEAAKHMGDTSEKTVRKVTGAVDRFMAGQDRALTEALEKVPAKFRGGLIDAFTRLRRGQTELEKGGASGVGAAMRFFSPAAMIQVLTRVAKDPKLGGAKNFSDLVGNFGLAFRNFTSLTEENVDHLIGVQRSIELQREEIVQAVKGTLGDEETDKDKKQEAKERQDSILKALRERSISKEDALSLSDFTVMAIANAITKPTKTEVEEQLEQAKTQGKLTQSIAKKIDVVINGIFNYLYAALTRIVDLMTELMNNIPWMRRDPVETPHAKKMRRQMEVDQAMRKAKREGKELPGVSDEAMAAARAAYARIPFKPSAGIPKVTIKGAPPAALPARTRSDGLPAVPSGVPSVGGLPSTRHLAFGGRTEDVLDMQGREAVSNLQSLYDAMRRRGIRLDESQLTGAFKRVLTDGTLSAMRTALLEYALYTAEDQDRLIQRMRDSGIGTAVKAAEEFETLKPNALGGDVVGIAAGRAVVASPGEGLASVARGERIVPAGGKGGDANITINVNGVGGSDLANLLREKVAEGVYEYKKREKYH